MNVQLFSIAAVLAMLVSLFAHDAHAQSEVLALTNSTSHPVQYRAEWTRQGQSVWTRQVSLAPGQTRVHTAPMGHVFRIRFDIDTTPATYFTQYNLGSNRGNSNSAARRYLFRPSGRNLGIVSSPNRRRGNYQGVPQSDGNPFRDVRIPQEITRTFVHPSYPEIERQGRKSGSQARDWILKRSGRGPSINGLRKSVPSFRGRSPF